MAPESIIQGPHCAGGSIGECVRLCIVWKEQQIEVLPKLGSPGRGVVGPTWEMTDLLGWEESTGLEH